MGNQTGLIMRQPTKMQGAPTGMVRKHLPIVAEVQGEQRGVQVVAAERASYIVEGQVHCGQTLQLLRRKGQPPDAAQYNAPLGATTLRCGTPKCD